MWRLLTCALALLMCSQLSNTLLQQSACAVGAALTPHVFCCPRQVEAYFQSKGLLKLAASSAIEYYWMGAFRQGNPSLYVSGNADLKPFVTIPGTLLSQWAPSNGPLEGPQYKAYSHWAPSLWGAPDKMFNSGNGDCVLSDVIWG